MNQIRMLGLWMVGLAVLSPLRPATAQDCEIDPLGETILEEDGPCVELRGSTDALHDVDGHDGHAYWTPKDEADPDYDDGIFWMLEFIEAGDYDVWAYVPAGLTDLTEDADYKVSYDGASLHAHLSQAAAPGAWLYIGQFAFNTGEDQWVRLGDNTTGGDDQDRKVAFDALRIGSTVESDDDDDDDDTGDDDGGSGDDDDEDTNDDQFKPHNSGGFGCSCESVGRAPVRGVIALALGILTLLWLRSRPPRTTGSGFKRG